MSPSTRELAGPELAPRDFERLRQLVRHYTGICLAANKQEMVAARLRHRLTALRLPSFGAYHAYLSRGTGGAGERTAFINAITTNKTEFFREPHHFALLRELAAGWQRATPRPLRLWSAACSTGEEPYSIAMALHDLLPPPRWDVRILATDIDTDVLQHAHAALYKHDRLEGLHGVRRLFEVDGDRLRVRPELRGRVDFAQVNLAGNWKLADRFDAIFCRNVVIYFDGETQRRLFARLAEQLLPGGHLFLGHSETLSGLDATFEAVGPTVYRKRAEPKGKSHRMPRARTTRTPILDAARPAPATAAPRVLAGRFALGPGLTPIAALLPKRPARPGPAAAAIPLRRLVVGEAVACKEPTRLVTLLGSCVAACLYDPVAAVGGMNHFLLPTSPIDASGARYGLHAMELLINEVMRVGGDRRRLQGKLFGAAHVLDLVSADVPARNAEFARRFFASEGIPLISSRLGGHRPLEIQFFTDCGRALVRPVAGATPGVRHAEERAAALATSNGPGQPGSVELWI
ncbi:MAG TPA: CheR family methyltransferase [Kofleriaceae bacterium]|nr:CheR family methyltransferase [Kofleriaceae bacterium]